MNSSNTYCSLISLLLLMIAILLSFSVQGLYPSNPLATSDSSQQVSLCENLNQPASAADTPSEINTRNQDSSSAPGSTTTAYSCNISVQMIPVEKQFLQPPTESAILISARNATLSSQVFVFQEPDPPQFG